jgi:ABC-2 type transport system permease protein
MSAFTNDAEAVSAVLPVGRTISRARVFMWSVRREIWEYRWLTASPLIGVAILLLGFLLATVQGAIHGFHLSITAEERREMIAASGIILHALLDLGIAIVLICAAFAGIVYCLGTLHNERRDRTILFWKSLPVSNVMTVMAKAFIPLALLPIVIIAAEILIQIALGIGLLCARSWFDVPVAQGFVTLLTKGMLVDHALIFSLSMAPIFGWFLAVSSASRRSPALWGFGIPFAAVVIERIATGQSIIGTWIERCFTRCFDGLAINAHIDLTMADNSASFQTQTASLADGWHAAAMQAWASQALWGGLIGTAVCIAFAIWMRRRQEPA